MAESMTSLKEELVELYTVLHKYNHEYYINSSPSVSDAEYDRLFQRTIEIETLYPNFITNKKITAKTVVLHLETDEALLTDRVVIIEGADPGFDWIFSKKIAGLITKYGGVNSHMAIRCAEFGIPAAIGCGEQRFEKLITKSKVHLDCASGLINSLH